MGSGLVGNELPDSPCLPCLVHRLPPDERRLLEEFLCGENCGILLRSLLASNSLPSFETLSNELSMSVARGMARKAFFGTVKGMAVAG